MERLEKWVLTFSDKPYPECSFQLQLWSVCVYMCVHCTCVFMFVAAVAGVTVYGILYAWVCVCNSSRRGSQQALGMGIPAHQDSTRGTDGALWGVPCFSPATSSPHLLPHILTPPTIPSSTASCAQPLQFHQSTCSFFYGKAAAHDPLRIWVSWNAWPQVRNNKNVADHLSNMQYWLLASRLCLLLQLL